jgi:hypothetical protein
MACILASVSDTRTLGLCFVDSHKSGGALTPSKWQTKFYNDCTNKPLPATALPATGSRNTTITGYTVMTTDNTAIGALAA